MFVIVIIIDEIGGVMKKATCKQLAGACDEVITGNTPEEMGEKSRAHAMKMVESGDEAHKVAMDEMMKMSPEEQQKWYQDFVNNFDNLEDV